MQTNIKDGKVYGCIEHMDFEDFENITDAKNLIFPSIWSVWIHSNVSANWTLESYHKIMEIKNVCDMWEFLNNFDKLDYMNYQFFIMKNDIKPIWEDPMNINGGAASLRIKLSDKSLLKIWENVCVFTLNNQICNTPDSINGISFNLKNDITVIKIWNSDAMLDISNQLSKKLIETFNITNVVYITNRPNK